MSERLGLLFSDDSILVLPKGADVDTALKECKEHDWNEPQPRTRVVRLQVEIIAVL